MTSNGAQDAGRRTYEVGVESRRRILDAAEELIAERGFEKTSIVEIARRSGVSRGSIPWHFDNKDGVLLAVVDRVTQRDLGLDDLAEMPTLQDVFARYAAFLRGSGARLFFSVVNEGITSTGPVHEQYQRFYAGERQKLIEWMILEEIEPAETRQRLASAILGALMGSALQWLVDPDGVDLDATLDSLATMVKDHLEAQLARAAQSTPPS